MTEANSTNGNERVATRALRAAVRGVTNLTVAIDVTAPDDRVWLDFHLPLRRVYLTPERARMLAEALLRGAQVAERSR